MRVERRIRLPFHLWTCILLGCISPLADGSARTQARRILSLSRIEGGLIVHIPSEDGRLTAALRVNDRFVVQGLDPDPSHVADARACLSSQGLCGPVSVDRLVGNSLPYVDNFVNLMVVESSCDIPMAEIMRVLAPEGVVLTRENGHWTRETKPRPKEIDEWTHYLHDTTGNPVAHDALVGPPAHLQWVGSPRWTRHHDRMSSVSALVSSGGRVFFILDEGSRASVILPSKWALVARDAFNGTPLWRREIPVWHDQLWPLKSGPTQLTRRLVAERDRVYATLSLDAPVTCLDAATGKTMTTYHKTENTEEILSSQGVLILLVRPTPSDEPPFVPDRSETWADTKRVNQDILWDGKPRQILAIREDTGGILWRRETRVMPMTLAADTYCVYFHDGTSVWSLDRDSGEELWKSEPVVRRERVSKQFGPNLIAYEDVIVFTGGDRHMTGLNAVTGEILWTAPHPPSGHASQEDLMIAGGLVWSGDISSGKDSGVFNGLDPRTGEVKVSFPPDVDAYWFHHRCHRSKATDRYLLTSRTGIEFIDIANRHWIPNHWIRGSCVYGVMPCNGLLYAPPHPCACYMESKLIGFNVLAAESETRIVPKEVSDEDRLEAGLATSGALPTETLAPVSIEDWPTYRHDPARSGATSAFLSSQLGKRWEAQLGGRLSGITVAEGRLFVAATDAHTLHSLDLQSGGKLWAYVAGARIDSPPTIYRGRVLFGCADGWITCLGASDGALIWRFRAATVERRLMAYEQIESAWPVSGSVLIVTDPDLNRDVLTCVAGRSMFIDGGLRFLRLDPMTGQMLSEVLLDEADPGTGQSLQSRAQVLNMPVALPDILSFDGQRIYMRSQPFDLLGNRDEDSLVNVDPVAIAETQSGENRHLFCPTGFLEDSGFHRSYWLYGRRYSAGCNWWANAGRFTPAGQILSFNDDAVYGYSRKPDYYQWSVPLDYQLFGCAKDPEFSMTPSAGSSEITVANSESLNPMGKPLALVVWVRATQPEGVILARGGSSHGYELMLKRGKPCFAVRVEGGLFAAKAQTDIVGRWTHLAGVLTEGKKLQLFLDGVLAAEIDVPGFIKADPNDGMEIGTDNGSPVGEYDKAPKFVGQIDEVSVYDRDLSADEVKACCQETPSVTASEGLVLHYSFDRDDAKDDSGNRNHGGVGAIPVDGKFGRAMDFDAAEAMQQRQQSRPSHLSKHFAYRWSLDCPITVRAMALTQDTLFVAGPPDVLDEEEAYRRHLDADILSSLREQDRALEGRSGGLLIAVAKDDGRELARYRLSSPPTWDSMAAADGTLCFSTLDGHVICMEGR